MSIKVIMLFLQLHEVSLSSQSSRFQHLFEQRIHLKYFSQVSANDRINLGGFVLTSRAALHWYGLEVILVFRLEDIAYLSVVASRS